MKIQIGIIACLLALRWTCSCLLADVPSVVAFEPGLPGEVNHDNYIASFELYRNGLYWCAGSGSCTTENGNLGKVGVIFSLPPPGSFISGSHPVGDCRVHVGGTLSLSPRGATRDDTYVYFAQDDGVRLKRLGAIWSDPNSFLVAPANGRQVGTLVLANGRLFWSDFDGSTVRVLSMNPDGSGQQTNHVRAGARITRLVVGAYRTGVFNQTDTFYMLDNAAHLYRFDYATPNAVAFQLATNATDFTIRDESFTSSGINDYFTTVYAVVYNANLIAIRADSGFGSLRYTSSGSQRLRAVGLDDHYIFLLEQTDCGVAGLCGYTLLRQSASPANTPSGPWSPAIIATDGSGVFDRSNIRCDGHRVYWASNDRILALPTGAAPIELDFKALGVEAVQTTQDLYNTQALVQGKPTIIRAYATATRNTTGRSPLFPSARLRMEQNGVSLGTNYYFEGGLVDATTDLTTLRGDAKHSFVFELPSGLNAGVVSLEFTINYNGALHETGSDTNTVVSSVQVIRGGRPCLVAAAVQTYEPYFDPFNPNSGWIRILNRTKSMLPVEDIDWRWWYWRISRPGGGPFDLGNGNLQINDAEWSRALSALQISGIMEEFRCNDTHYIGMVPESVPVIEDAKRGNSTGNAIVAAMDSWASDSLWDSPMGGYTLAHELGHNYRRPHAPCYGEANIGDYPYPPCQIGFGSPPVGADQVSWGFDPISLSLINPVVSSDLMSYGPSNWVSDFTWSAILGQMPISSGTNTVGPQPLSLTPVLVLQGLVDPVRDAVLLEPFYQFQDGVLPEDKVNASFAAAAVATNSPYVIRLLDPTGAVLASTPLVLDDILDQRSNKRPFLQIVPFPIGTHRVQIVSARGVRAERWASAHAPVLSLANLAVNTADQTLALSWSASDPDGDPLLFMVQFSENGGVSWRTLIVNYPALSAALSTRLLPGSTQCLVRVLATDGLHTAVATSSLFALPRNPPLSVIEGVRPAQRLAFGDNNSLIGTAFDAEDGAVPDSRLQWNLTGPTSLATSGAQLRLESLSPGSYTATLTAPDADGPGLASVNFDVAPLLVPDGNDPELDGFGEDSGYREAVKLPLPFSDGGLGNAQLFHSAGYLYVSFSNLKYAASSNDAATVGLTIDTNNDHSSVPESGDVGFFATDIGLPFQTVAEAIVDNPQPGFTAVIARGDQAWSAEFRIAENLIGGWNHAVGLSVRFMRPGVSSTYWPPNAQTNNPGTWGPAFLGSAAPPPANRAPVANAGADRIENVQGGELLFLNGTGSSDPEGSLLTFSWTQIGGPSVTLSDSASAAPSFTAPAVAGTTLFRFRLTVSDSSLSSVPVTNTITLVRAQVQTNSGIARSGEYDISNGRFDGRLNWPGSQGDLIIVEATTNLIDWVTIATNTVDFYQSILFTDSRAGLFPHRFYRAKSAEIPCASIPPGLVGWWPAEGDASDRFGTNHGTLVNNLGFTSGEVLKAFNFVSPGQEVNVPASASLDVGAGPGFTIEGWVNPNDATNQYPLAEWNSGSSIGCHFWISVLYAGHGGQGSIYASLTGALDGIFATGPGIILPGVWQHVALTYDKSSGVGRLYHNGIEVSNSTLGLQRPQTTFNLHLGFRPGGPTYNGALDEFTLYNRALGAAELLSIFEKGSIGKCGP